LAASVLSAVTWRSRQDRSARCGVGVLTSLAGGWGRLRRMRTVTASAPRHAVSERIHRMAPGRRDLLVKERLDPPDSLFHDDLQKTDNRSAIVLLRADFWVGCSPIGEPSKPRGDGPPFAREPRVVVIRTPNGDTAEYRVRRTAQGLRLELQTASYDLLAMLNAGWQIVGTKTHAAERLLRRAGMFTSDIDRLPPARRFRWRRTLIEAPRESFIHASPQ
jgi:hypothetical protein